MASAATRRKEAFMPEQITKYPDVTLKVLKDAGAAAARGPAENSEAVPGRPFLLVAHGGICIYGMNEIPKMTQITRLELARCVCPKAQQSGILGLDPIIFGAVFLVGLTMGRFFRFTHVRQRFQTNNSISPRSDS